MCAGDIWGWGGGSGTRAQLAILICFVPSVLSLGECLRFFIARVAAARPFLKKMQRFRSFTVPLSPIP